MTTEVDTTASASNSSVQKNENNTNTSLNKYNILNLIAYLVNCFVTFGIGTFGLANRPTNGDISDKYQTIVTPFGTSFSIWGIIFLWQAFWVLWQFMPSQRNSEGVIKASYFYPAMTLFQAGWTISFSYEIMWLSLVFMYAILATLVAASMSLQTYKKTIKGYMLWQGPFSIQTGWIMAAAAVNTNVLPVAYGASVPVKLAVSSVSLVVLAVTALSWLASYPVDFAIPLVIMWALGGVYAELQAPSQPILEEFTTKQIDGVQYGILAGLVLVGVATLMKSAYVLFKQRPDAIAAAKDEEKHIVEESAASSESDV